MTTWLPDTTELEIVDVADRGIANRERIILKINADTDLGQFGVILAWSKSISRPMQAWPVRDNFFWFGNGMVKAGEVIFLYTGSGEPKKTTVQGTDVVAYVLHWERPTTMFADGNIVPLLLKMSEVWIGHPRIDVSQLPPSAGSALTLEQTLGFDGDLGDPTAT